MPRPTENNATYLPGLDGLRAISVLIVLGYHLEVPTMGGGLVGVGMFFTLSGFLITSILLRELVEDDRVDLRRFWLRRLRRLLPALVVVLVTVLGLTAVLEPEEWWPRVWLTLGALVYVSNWQTIVSGESYFDRFEGPGPFDHLWSLAIEEQFYVFWPLLLVGLWSLSGPVRRRSATTLMLVVTGLLTVASFAALALIAEPGFDNTRAYEGTDTRAGAMLLGALLAMTWRPGRRASGWRPSSLNLLDAGGLVALGLLGWIVAKTDQFSMGLYHGGLLSLAIATGLLVAVVAQPTSRVGRGLGCSPLRWIGERSYGIYLWHVPIIAFLPNGLVERGWMAQSAVVVPATMLAASLSWSLVEDPIRRHGLRGLWSRGMSSTPPDVPDLGPTRPPKRRFGAVAGLGSLLALALVAMAAFVVFPRMSAVDAIATAPVGTASDAPTTTSPSTTSPSTTPSSTTTSAPDTIPSTASSTTIEEVVSDPTVTGCERLTHIGDSTSVGLIAENVLVDPDLRVDEQYRTVGVGDVTTDIAGAISIIETIEGEPNAEDRVVKWVEDDPDRCWVLALGTNDAANMSIGGASTGAGRIDRIMEHVDGRPALWLTVRTLLSRSPYADDEMAQWNEALVEACTRYPNLAVYDWAAEVEDEWFIADGIHFTTDGYAERAARIASGLVQAFPDGTDDERAGPCLVTSDLE